MNTTSTPRPGRLHHHAFVVADQARTRRFYEDVIGLPLVETWCEQDDVSDYCHTFYELGDGSSLAFFQFAKPEVQAANTAPPGSVYYHVALDATTEVQLAIAARAEEASVPTLRIDHGYCVSLYVSDPDGLLVEITVDNPDAARDAATRRANAGNELSRWLAGNHADNNAFRAH